jgi:hypothetical protein
MMAVPPCAAEASPTAPATARNFPLKPSICNPRQNSASVRGLAANWRLWWPRRPDPACSAERNMWVAVYETSALCSSTTSLYRSPLGTGLQHRAQGWKSLDECGAPERATPALAHDPVQVRDVPDFTACLGTPLWNVLRVLCCRLTETSESGSGIPGKIRCTELRMQKLNKGRVVR